MQGDRLEAGATGAMQGDRLEAGATGAMHTGAMQGDRLEAGATGAMHTGAMHTGAMQGDRLEAGATVWEWVARFVGVVAMLLIALAWLPPAPANSEEPLYAAVLQDVDDARRAPFGVEVHNGRLQNATLQQRAEEMGTAWVRFNSLSWRDVQSEPDTPIDAWNWDAMSRFEADLEQAAAMGLTPLVIVDDFPDWATIPYINPYTNEETIAPCAALKEEYFDDYATFLREAVARYKEPPYSVRYWEMGNEVDVDPRLLSGDLQELFGCWGNIEDPYYGGEHYGEMLKVVVPEMRGVDPDAQIVIGGFLMDRADTQVVGRGKPEKFFEGILKAGAADMMDVVSFHSYPWYDWEQGREGDSDLSDYRWSMWGGMTIGKARYLRDVMQQYDVDKPLMLSEAALLFWGATPTEDFLQAQADHAVRVVTRAMSQGIQAHIWYTLHSSGWNSSGLLYSNNEPKPAYTAYRQLAQQVGASNFTPEIVTTYASGIEAYRFAVGTHSVDVVWSQGATDKYSSLSDGAFVEAFSRDGAAIVPMRSPARVVVPVGIAPVYIHHAVQDADSVPRITSVSPSEALNDGRTSVTINGAHFSSSCVVALEQVRGNEIVSYGVELESVGSAGELLVDVPAFLPPGMYDFVVSRPDGGVAVQAGAFEVVAAYSPQIERVLPHHGQADADMTLHVYGTEDAMFLEDAVVHIGPLRLSPTYTMRMSDNHVRVSVLAGMLDAGRYALSVTNPDTVQDTLADALVVLGADESDMTGYAFELWSDPLVPRVGVLNEVGLVVHYQGDDVRDDAVAVPVDFWRFAYDVETGKRASDSVALGSRTVEFSESPSAVSTEALVWTPEVSGTYKLCARIDADDVVHEAIEDNNEVCRVVQVLPEASDVVAPEIQSFTMQDGQDVAITPTVGLRVVANDVGSAVSSLLVQEYEYSVGAALWVPVQASTGWITYMDGGVLSWSLLPSPGKKYVQVWAADEWGNVAWPASASIAYEPQQGYGTFTPPGGPFDRTVPPALLAIEPPDDVLYRVYLPLIQ